MQLAIISTQKVTRATSHDLHFSMCLKCPPAAQMQAEDVDTTYQQHVNNCMNQSGPHAVDVSFQFVDLQLYNEDEVTDFHYTTQCKFIVVNGQTTTSAFHKVA